MTSCAIPSAHRYDSELGVVQNVVGVPSEATYPFWCPHGFVVSMDQSSAVLFFGSILGTVAWRRWPRFATAAIVGAGVFWATYQAWALDIVLTRYESAFRYDAAAREYAREAALSQAIFELLALAVMPVFLTICVARLSFLFLPRREAYHD